MKEVTRNKEGISKEMKKADEEVEARGREEQTRKARKRKSKDVAHEGVENDETGCKEKTKRWEKNSHGFDNIMNNVSCDSQEAKDETKQKKVGELLDKVTDKGQQTDDDTKEKKKRRKKKEEEDGKHLDKNSDESREIEDNYKEKKKKKRTDNGNGKLENENKEKRKKRKMVTTTVQKNEKCANEIAHRSLENENKGKKKKREMEIEDQDVEDQETEKHIDNGSFEKEKRGGKKKRKKEDRNSSLENQETGKKMEKGNDYELETGKKKTKKPKSRKSKSKEDGTLCFVKNDDKEGLKNILVNENGEIEDDTIDATNQVESNNEHKGSSKKDDTPVEDETVKKKKKEKKKGRKKEEVKSSEKENSDASDKKMAGEEALLYLRMWKDDRSKWAFKKVRQVWLLKHMFNASKIPDQDFKVLLLYLEGLQGMARKTTISRAEALLESGNDEQKEEEVDLDRVRRLLQILI